MVNPEIVIVDEQDFESKKKKIAEQGTSKLHVLADFDKTLTTLFLNNGAKVNSLISILRNGNYLDEDYVNHAKELFEMYHPIEINPEISFQDKKQKMHEWWEKHFELLAEKKLDKNILKKCAEDIDKDGLLVLRQGVGDFFKWLGKNNVPLLIISASVGDLIHEFLKVKGLLNEDIHVIANEFEYNSDGEVLGVKKIVHVLNKDESSVKNFPEVHEKVKDRKNVILIGDGTGDVGMIHGFDYNELLKIGFLNENVEQNLEEYKKHFDVVLTGDQDFGFVNKLLEEIFS